MSAEAPVTVEGQAQILHAGSDPDLSPFQPQVIAHWRRPVIGPAATPHCLGFFRGHSQPQSLDRGDHAGHRQFRQMGGSAPRRAPDQHQRVVGVARQCRVRSYRCPEYSVVRDAPQQRIQHRILCRRYSDPGGTPAPHPAVTRSNSRAQHILSQGMLLKALTTSSDTANAT